MKEIFIKMLVLYETIAYVYTLNGSPRAWNILNQYHLTIDHNVVISLILIILLPTP